MDLFFDTNIIIGYSIDIDFWNYYAERLFNDEVNLYWSETVKTESEEKINELILLYNGFFTKIKEELSNGNISKNQLKDISKKIKKIDDKEIKIDSSKIAELIWNSTGGYETIETFKIMNTLDKYRENINKITLPRYNYCQKMLKLHNRTNKYPQLISQIQSLRKGNEIVHGPDDEIIIDCHDLAHTKKISVSFVSSDKKLLKFKEEILELTKIYNMLLIDEAYHYIKKYQ